MAPLNESERREVWEICEDRYQTRSTVLTSQLPVSRWHEQIGDPTIADGILDRLVHNAYRIEMRGAKPDNGSNRSCKRSLGNASSKASRRPGFTCHLGGSWNRTGPNFLDNRDARGSKFCKALSGSLSFF
jgi:hypothetical protein